MPKLYQDRLRSLQTQHALKLGLDRGARQAIDDLYTEVDTELRQLLGQLEVPMPGDAPIKAAAVPAEPSTQPAEPAPAAPETPTPAPDVTTAKAALASPEPEAPVAAPDPAVTTDPAQSEPAPPPTAGTAEGTGGTMGRPATPQGQFGLPASMPPGTPTATSFSRMLVAMDRVVPGATTIAKINQRLRAIVDAARGVTGTTPVRTGRFAKRFEGVYKEGPKVVRVWDLMNLPATSHEIAHALADAVYGTAHTSGIQTQLPRDVARELAGLGRALYGNTRPNAGYIAEGWAELLSDYLTSDTVRAPRATAWLEQTVLPRFPEVAQALKQARTEIDIWRGMGAEARLKAQTKTPGNPIVEEAKTWVTKSKWIEEFAPLEAMVDAVQKLTGRTLRADEDPYLIASARRGTAGGVLEQMVERGMIDPSGNLRGRSLREALAPVTAGLKPWQIVKRQKRAQDFWNYLRARRSIERWAKGKNPGMALADAQYLRAKLETPDFQVAANLYYQWWDGVMEYLAEASPANRTMVDAIRNASTDYVPLARYIDPKLSKPGASGRISNALRRMYGSSREVMPVDMQTIRTAESLIARAHRDQVLDAIFQLQRYDGVGPVLEEVPRDKVRQTVDIAKLRQELESMGVDTTGVADGTLLEFYQPAQQPKGVDPIIARTVNGETKWYQVPAELYDLLQGMQPKRLPLALDLVFGAPARAFRLGTTGLRPAFALVTNPIRDFQTFLLQSNTDTNPLKRVSQYFGGLNDIVLGSFGKTSPYLDLFERLAITAGQPLGGDMQQARRASKGLFHGKILKKVTSPVETLRELLSVTEAAPRIAELRLKSQEVGWSPGQPLTPEQAILLTLAAKRVTTDFSAGGSVSKKVSQAVPFFNASLQGARTFGRTLREKPALAVLHGLTLITVPTLFNWWRNKDEEWYKALPARERYLYLNVPDDQGRVWQIPRPFDWANLFGVMPEALLDAAYRQDPQAINDGFGHIFASQNPIDYPVLGRVLREQWENRVAFFDRPIVPRGQLDLLPGEQTGPYTSWLATTLGRAFPETISPRRLDAAVRGFFGGAVPDLLQFVEQSAGLRPKPTAADAEDIPVFGKLFRRGGQYSAANQYLSDLYDLHYYWDSRANSKARKLKGKEEYGRRVIRSAYEQIREAQKIADRTQDPDARRRIYQKSAEKAKQVLDNAKRAGLLQEQQAIKWSAQTVAPITRDDR